MSLTMIPQYSTKLFNEIYTDVTTFISDYGNLGFPATISEDNAKITYYLLLGRYGNNPISNLDETQFKIKLQSVIWQFGPTWEKRLDIQKALRALEGETLTAGSKVHRANDGKVDNYATDTANNSTVQNHATNPSYTASWTGSTSELPYVDQQVANNDKSTVTNIANNTYNGSSDEVRTLGTMDAYQQIWDLLDNDVTEDYLVKFRPLFKFFVRPEETMIYETEE